MNSIALVTSFLATGVSIFALRPVAGKVGLIDMPGGHKTHFIATPLVGGLGIFCGILLTSLFTPGALTQFAPFLSLSALVLFIGTIDDAKELTAVTRMTGHTLVALAMATVAGVQLNSFGDLLNFGPIELGVLSLPLTIFATVGVINAINMADGIDGLSGGLVVVALGFLALFSFISGDIVKASFIAMVICSIAAFLSLNFRRPWHRRALVYLGDAGSNMLGFMLVWLFLEATQDAQPLFSPVYALWFLAIPLIDTVNLLIKRPLQGRSPFTPGNDHLHHMLLSRGFSVGQTVLIILVMAIVCGGIGLLGISLDLTEYTMFQLFIALFSFYFLFADRIAKNPSSS